MRMQWTIWLLVFGLSSVVLTGAGGLAGGLAEGRAWALAGAGGLAAAQPAGCSQLVQNGGFESGAAGWQQVSAQGYPLIGDFNPRTGGLGADLGGANNADDRLSQTITLPPADDLTLTGWWYLDTAETAGIFDTLTVSLHRPDGTALATLATLDNTATVGVWDELTFDLSGYAGQSVILRFAARTDQENISEFFLDDISLWACPLDGTPTPTLTVTPVTATPTATASATAPSPARRLYLPLILK